MSKLPEESTESSARKSVQRGVKKTKAARSPARAAASPAKTSTRTRLGRRETREPLPEPKKGPANGPPDGSSSKAVSSVALPLVPPRSGNGSDVDLDLVGERMDRLERGLRLLSGTLKRAFEELSGSIETLRHDVARAATPEDLQRALARVEFGDRISSSPAAIHAAVERLAEGIAAAQVLVDEAEGAEVAQPPTPIQDAPELEPATPPRREDSPDPVAIWGQENGSDPALLDAMGPRDHRRRSAVRRRLEKSWPGRAYTQWKWRRT